MGYMATTLDVRSVEASLKFYIEVLGFTEWFRMGEVGLVAGGVEHNGGRILMSTAATVNPSGVGVYVGVDEDIDAIYARVKDQATVVDPIADRYWGDRTFTLSDPDGYRVEFAKTIEEG